MYSLAISATSHSIQVNAFVIIKPCLCCCHVVWGHGMGNLETLLLCIGLQVFLIMNGVLKN